jgi:hypothetical protein
MARLFPTFFILTLLSIGCINSINVDDSDFQPDNNANSDLLFLDEPQTGENPSEPVAPEDPSVPDPTEDPEDPSTDPDDPEEPVVPEPGSESCVQWQDCGPHFGDENSLYECVNNTCTCDPSGQSQNNCSQAGGHYVAQECFCAITETAPPSDPIEYDETEYEECWYHWHDVPCDPDEWVDTSYYTEECYYDSNNELICNTVYVNDGYWRDGHCPAGWWEVWCY